MPVLGTSYFVTFCSACRYYAPYGYDREDVADMIDAGSIHIGEPAIAEGEQLVRIDNGTRYGISFEARS